jgi:hypothetical protein
VTRWDLVTPADVAKSTRPANVFAVYCRQRLGVPGATVKDLLILKARARQFFEENPGASWLTLCRVIDWCRSRKWRLAKVWNVFDCAGFAFQDGFLPELDPSDEDPELEQEIQRALEVETRESWQRRLIVSRGATARRMVLEEWKHDRAAGTA